MNENPFQSHFSHLSTCREIVLKFMSQFLPVLHLFRCQNSLKLYFAFHYWHFHLYAFNLYHVLEIIVLSHSFLFGTCMFGGFRSFLFDQHFIWSPLPYLWLDNIKFHYFHWSNKIVMIQLLGRSFIFPRDINFLFFSILETLPWPQIKFSLFP